MLEHELSSSKSDESFSEVKNKIPLNNEPLYKPTEERPWGIQAASKKKTVDPDQTICRENVRILRAAGYPAQLFDGTFFSWIGNGDRVWVVFVGGYATKEKAQLQLSGVRALNFPDSSTAKVKLFYRDK